jgi:hypothetical protein
LSALRSPTVGVSIYSYIRDLRLASANEVLADSEQNDWREEEADQSEPVAEAAFNEFDDRRRACGGDLGHYPFDVGINAIRLKDGADKSLYTFLALLSWFGKDAGPKGTDGEKLFEEICAKAAERYLGGPHAHVKSFVFGFPRHLQPAGFAAALDKLCQELREGKGHREGRPTLPNQKDAKLDIVAWRAFEDRREGQLITFGQCATGKNWEEKITELPPPHIWCAHWMADSPVVDPIRSFFVPHRIDQSEWSLKSRLGGILYDRCRIANLASGLNANLKTEWTAWSLNVLQRIRST